MGKLSYDDKLRIQTLRELGFGYRTIVGKFLEKNWNIWSVKAVCKSIRFAVELRKSIFDFDPAEFRSVLSE